MTLLVLKSTILETKDAKILKGLGVIPLDKPECMLFEAIFTVKSKSIY